MQAGSGPNAPQQGTRRGLLWALVVAVVVLAAAAGVLLLWPDGERVTVPDLVGLEETAAESVLSAVGLMVSDIQQETVDASSSHVGTVLSQEPSAGTEVSSGTHVALIVAEAGEEASAEETETSPAGGGSAGGGGGGADPDPVAEPDAEPEADPGAEPEAEPTWTQVARHLGSGNYDSPTFTTTSTRLRLGVMVSMTSGASIIRFDVVPQAPGEATRSVSVPATPDQTGYRPELDNGPPGTYHLSVGAPAAGEWSCIVYEWAVPPPGHPAGD